MSKRHEGEGDKGVWIKKVQTLGLVENMARQMTDGTESQTRCKRNRWERMSMLGRGEARFLFGEANSVLK